MLAPKRFYGVKDVNKHEHEYGDPRIARITKITNKRYFGTAGDKAFLARGCRCGKFHFFDYGSYKAMKDKLLELKSPAADAQRDM